MEKETYGDGINYKNGVVDFSLRDSLLEWYRDIKYYDRSYGVKIEDAKVCIMTLLHEEELNTSVSAFLMPVIMEIDGEVVIFMYMDGTMRRASMEVNDNIEDNLISRGGVGRYVINCAKAMYKDRSGYLNSIDSRLRKVSVGIVGDILRKNLGLEAMDMDIVSSVSNIMYSSFVNGKSGEELIYHMESIGVNLEMFDKEELIKTINGHIYSWSSLYAKLLSMADGASRRLGGLTGLDIDRLTSTVVSRQMYQSVPSMFYNRAMLLVTVDMFNNNLLYKKTPLSRYLSTNRKAMDLDIISTVVREL